MNYLTVINRYCGNVPSRNILFSGCDEAFRNHVLRNIIHSAARAGKALVVVDNCNLLQASELESVGYRVRNGLAGEFSLCNPFAIDTPLGLIRFRDLLDSMGCTEALKNSIVHYMNYLAYVDGLDKGGRTPVNLELLRRYGTVAQIERHLLQLRNQGIITPEEQIHLLTKYSEISAEAADFEKMLYLLVLFLQGEYQSLDTAGLAVVYHLRDLDGDATFCSVLNRMLAQGLKDCNPNQIAVLILDRGYGNRNYISDLTVQLPDVERHLLSEDLFTLDSKMMTSLRNRFNVKLYTRHQDTDSCNAVENATSKIQVVEQTHSVQHDRRWRANSPWDTLLGNNRTDTTSTGPLTWKARFPADTIKNMSDGLAILDTAGMTTIVPMIGG